jgi:hypothetical protein
MVAQLWMPLDFLEGFATWTRQFRRQAKLDAK